MSDIPEKYVSVCPLDHSTFEKYMECDCNYGSAREVWWFKEQKIKSLEQEVERLKEENLKLINCHNCKFPIFDYGEMDCRKKDKSFYEKYDLLYCDKWEIRK